ncbi:uncharacterized protein BcabD6B2_30410 [Babesia caballi]|uniref:Uncharacterized protein n=1 Tax=Babesia caballi TaxID=5871 RepID=A0AAV4LUT9_BABCB|nr:hypothetical protein, conserved [Babesia caballi]
MGGKKNSLKDPPTSLKEAIDWLASIEGYGVSSWSSWGWGKYDELAAALYKLAGFEAATKETLNGTNLGGLIKNFSDKLGRGFLGYEAQGGYTFSDDGIIRKNGEYTSTYDGAPWPQDSTELQQCALILLGSAYVTYYFVTFLYWACSGKHIGPWKSWTLGGSVRTGETLKNYLQNMGFNINSLVKDKWGFTVANDLEKEANGFTELKKPSRQTLYSDFLQQLEQRHQTITWQNPLIGCYRLANCYFNQNKTSPVTQAMEKINIEFESFRGTRVHTYETLKTNIKNFLESVTTFTPTPSPLPHPQTPSGGSNTSSDHSSPAGPVAGTLTTLGLGGGAAAAYLFNLGGAKTLVNALLKIG